VRAAGLEAFPPRAEHWLLRSRSRARADEAETTMPAGTAEGLEVLVGDATSAVGTLCNRFHVVTVAFRRFAQIHAGSRLRLEPDGHKPCVQAVAEVRAGVVPYLTPSPGCVSAVASLR
jgi:DNA-directed RNA polymerase subunit K/omega